MTKTDEQAPKMILLVDDEEDVAKVVRGRLTLWGYEVVVATDGQEALNRVQQRIPHLILLDLKMPVLNGGEVCRRLKADPKFSRIPIILMTSSSEALVKEELRAIPADDCLLKPFEPSELQEKIKKWTH